MNDKVFAYMGKTLLVTVIAFVIAAYLGEAGGAATDFAWGAMLGALLASIGFPIIEGIVNE